MSAVRMILIGVVGVSAGALLATTMVPSFAPYREGTGSRPYFDQSGSGEAYAMAHAAREQGDDTGGADRGLGIRLGSDRGMLVLDLPDWAGDTVAWMGFGQRMWNDWRGFTERFEEAPQRYREMPQQDAPRSYGLARPDYNEEDQGYADDYEAQERESAPSPTYRLPDERSRPQDDAVDLAARRAAEAARDVMAAQDL